MGTITKVLACAQDLVLGVGKVPQIRNGELVELDRLGVVFLVANLAQLRSLPITYGYAAIAVGSILTHYYYDATSTAVVNNTTVVLPDAGEGRWLLREQVNGGYTSYIIDSAADYVNGYIRWNQEGRLMTIEVQLSVTNIAFVSYTIANVIPDGLKPTFNKACTLIEASNSFAASADNTAKCTLRTNGTIHLHEGTSTIIGDYNGVIQYYLE